MKERSQNIKEVANKKKKYLSPKILFDEPLTVQCSVCLGGTYKNNPLDCPSGPWNS